MLRSPTPTATDLQLERIIWSFGVGLLISGLIPLAHISVASGLGRWPPREIVIALFAGVSTTIDVARATYEKNSAKPPATSAVAHTGGTPSLPFPVSR